METLAEFIARHHTAVGIGLAVIAGYSAWNAYRCGMRVQEIRVMVGDSARAASEALGG